MDKQSTYDWESFIDYYDTVRGWVRERLTQEYFREYLPSAGSTVVDVGGGDGRDAVWLADLGHEVTLLEPSADMLKKARLRARESGVNLQAINGDDSLLVNLGLTGFDMALSHGVLMYCEDPARHIRALAGAVKDGGCVSLLTNNYGGAVCKLTEKGADKAELDRLEKTHRSVNNIGIDVWAHERSEIIAMLAAAGLEVLQVKGVRSHYDYDDRPYAAVEENELEQILATERKFGTDEAYMDDKAQMLHYVAVKK